MFGASSKPNEPEVQRCALSFAIENKAQSDFCGSWTKDKIFIQYQRLYYLAQNFGSENWGYAAEGQGLARLVELQNNTLHLRVHRHVGTLADNIGTRQWK